MNALVRVLRGAAGAAVWCLIVGWWWKQLDPDDWPKSAAIRAHETWSARGRTWAERVRRLEELDTTLGQIRDLPEAERSS